MASEAKTPVVVWRRRRGREIIAAGGGKFGDPSRVLAETLRTREAFVRRILSLAVVISVTAAMSAGGASASGRRAKLELRKTSVGTILVTGQGLTIYAFTRDGHNRDACAKITFCPGTWPAVTTGARPVAGRGVRPGLIGTIRLRSGVRQVTYAGHPLYTYIADGGPGQTFYINFPEFGGRWPALDAAGREVK
jgi:predicted lipoprotein with Yx(FWY)xxD motif